VLTRLKKFAKPKGMKQRSPLAIVFSFCVMLATTALAGEQFKESKAVVPPPPPMCDWTGFYLGLHAGGEFGHSETFDSVTDLRFGYEESGFNGGGQLGYNFQWNCIVLGAEFDAGYMNLNGSGDEPHPPVAPGFIVRGETDSDFYTTLRGRLGVAPGNGCWLLYATGGVIGVNYTTRFHVTLDGNDFFDARDSDFDWGYTVGGGIERKIFNRHWSMKVEYLYFALDDQSFGNTQSGVTAHFDTHTFGHIVRAGLNYSF
jgi:outer membrane immunogenic protein